MSQQTICKNIILKYKVKDIAKFWSKLAKKSKQRFFLMRQWMQSEEKYLKDLQIIQQKLLPALIQQEIITEEQRWRLFPNLQQMQMLSQEMLKDITKFVKQWDVHKTVISESVLYISKFLKIYKAYINNMTAVHELMKKAGEQKSKEIRKIQNSLPKSENGGLLSLNDYLVKPMQRLTKHRIVIQNYLKAMRKTHQDYQSLSKAFQKFGQVVQQINKDMILSQNNQKLIKLQQVYGDIILNTRTFLGQSVGYCSQGPVRIYMFNDMLLVTKCIDPNKMSSQIDIKRQELFMRIQIDSYSFVRAPLDGRYQVNRLAIAGVEETLDIVFATKDQRNRCYQIMHNVVSEYYQKQRTRKQMIREVQSRRITAQRMSQNSAVQSTSTSPTQFQSMFGAQSFNSYNNKWKKTPLAAQNSKNFVKVMPKNSLNQIFGQSSKYKWKQAPKYQPFNLQFRFIGAEKRYSGSTLYYIFLVQTPLPIKIRQYIFLEFQQVQILENYLKQLYSKAVPSPNIPTIETKPKGMSWEEYKHNPIKLLENRAINLQIFLNYVFRNKKILQKPEYPSIQIRMHEMLWSYMTNLKNFQKCQCIWCINCNFQKQEANIEQFEKILHQYYESKRQQRQWKQICPNYLFNLQTKLAEKPISKQGITLERVLIIMHLKFHRLLSPFPFPTNKTVSRQLQFLNLPIHILNRNPLNPNLRIVEVSVKHHTTVRDVIIQLQVKLQIQCLLDFELCLVLNNDDQVYYLDQDQYIMEVSSKGSIQENKQEIKTQSPSKKKAAGFFKNLQRTLSQIGQSLSSTPRIYFYLKKAFILSPSLQIQACQRCQIRLNLIIGEIFYRFKNQKLALNFNDMKFLCAVYYALKIIANNKEKQFQGIKQNLHKKMDADIFKGILPEKKWYFIDNNFLKEIAEILNSFRTPNLINRKEVKKLFIKTYQIMLDKRSFKSQFFQIENTDPSSLPGSKQKLLAGVSQRFFSVSRLGQLTPLIQIPLQKLQYKVTGLDLYLQTQKKEFHFRGNNVFTLNKYIQMYKNIEIVQKMSAQKKNQSLNGNSE